MIRRCSIGSLNHSLPDNKMRVIIECDDKERSYIEGAIGYRRYIMLDGLKVESIELYNEELSNSYPQMIDNDGRVVQYSYHPANAVRTDVFKIIGHSNGQMKITHTDERPYAERPIYKKQNNKPEQKRTISIEGIENNGKCKSEDTI